MFRLSYREFCKSCIEEAAAVLLVSLFPYHFESVRLSDYGKYWSDGILSWFSLEFASMEILPAQKRDEKRKEVSG